MIYNLYFEANKQAHVIRLGEPKGSFIQYLTINTNGRDELLTIDKAIMLVSSTSINDDKKVFISDICLDEKSIMITLSDKAGTNKNLPSNDYVRVRGNEESVSIDSIENIIEDQDAYAAYNITFKYDNGDHNYTASVRVHCVPSRNLYDVVLDFGSEASQMLIKTATEGGAVIAQELFNNVLKHYWGATVKGKRVYDQQDEDKHLFRSIFYKKENGEMKGDDFEVLLPCKKDPYFSFVSRRNDVHVERIPNVKISFLTGKKAEGADTMRLHTGIILRFLHEGLTRIAEMNERAGGTKDTPIAVRFTLLLPNVMPQTSVSSLLERLKDFSNSDKFLNKHKDSINLLYINVQSCSESDASFLERMNHIGMTDGQRCLTIDVGKGTTDFSITRKLDASKAVSEFRSGFVGAGNALSFAIFLNYMRALGGLRYMDLIKKVLNSEQARLYELDNLIEEYKINWKDKKSSDFKTINVQTASIELILDKIREMGPIGDAYGEVKKLTESIADNILKRLPEVKIDKIVISGRAFKFKMLKDVLESKLREKFNVDRCYYDSKTAKSGCLFGACSDKQLSLSSSIVGVPFIIDASKLTDEPKKLVRELGESIENNTVELHPQKDEAKSALNSIISNTERFLGIIRDIFGNPDAGQVAQPTSETHSIRANEVKELMATGKEYQDINANSLISISGRFYTPLNYLIDNDNKPFSIYFDDNDFHLRCRNYSYKLIATAMQGSQELCFESQFPYSLKDGMELPNSFN